MPGQTPDHLHAQPDPPTGIGHDFKGDGDNGTGKGGGPDEGMIVEFNGTDMRLV